MSLNIEKQIAEQTVLKLEGRLDTATAPELEKCIEESLDQINELVFDFTDLEYISSAGLRVILKAQILWGLDLLNRGTALVGGAAVIFCPYAVCRAPCFPGAFFASCVLQLPRQLLKVIALGHICGARKA